MAGMPKQKCCCDEPGPCSHCNDDTVHYQYQVEFTGVVDLHCLECDDFNAAFIVTQVDPILAPCRFTFVGTPCSGNTPGDPDELNYIELEFDNSGGAGNAATVVRVYTFSGGAQAVFRLNRVVWPQDCDQIASGFTYDAGGSGGNGCDFTAASVTVTPI